MESAVPSQDRQTCVLRSRRRAIAAAVVCLWFVLEPWAPAEGQSQPTRVAILYGAQKSYRTAAATLEAKLEEMGYEVLGLVLPKKDDKAAREAVAQRLAGAQPAMIASVGRRATSFALEEVPETPVAFCMVPNARDAPFLNPAGPHKHRICGVTTDVSPEQQVRWIVRLCPKAKNVVVLHSARTVRTADALRTAAGKYGITITTIEADRDRFPQAVDVLNERDCDGVLMIPDARVYNVATIKRLLLWGLRRKKPVWGFSESIVKAGAFSGVSSDSRKVVHQTAELIQKTISGANPAGIGLQYPHHVDRAVNRRTAEMIGVPIDEKIVRAGAKTFGEKP